MTLEIKKLCKEFGGIKAVQNLDLTLEPGKITALIGPNGAGKTTIFNMITGFLRPTTGRIVWKNREITQKPPYLITRSGISRTFQEVKLFRSLTVAENLLMARRQRTDDGLLAGFLRHKAIEKETSDHLKEVTSFLQNLHLRDKLDVPATALSYGQSKLVEILRAVLSTPSLLMLDEPVAGLNPVMISTLKQFITTNVKEKGVTLFFIEHNIPFVFELADHVVVVDHGVKIAEGSPEMIRSNPEVIRAYLG